MDIFQLVRDNLRMIDLTARADVCEAIDGYLNDRVSAFEFDHQLTAIRSLTRDPTAHIVIGQLWHIYDDVDDHLVCLDKEGWDTVQRLKLVLESGAVIEAEQRTVWHFSQFVAAGCLTGMAFLCCIDFKIWPLPVLAGGLLSIALSKWRSCVHDAGGASDPWRAWPFSSPSAIAKALGRTTGFRKQRYRQATAHRQIRPAGETRAHWYHFLFHWCLFSPVPLLAQCLPVRTTRIFVRDVPATIS